MQLKSLLEKMIEVHASDVFIIAGLPLAYQASGSHVRTDTPPLTPADTQEYIETIYELAGRDLSLFTDSVNHDDDFSFAVPSVGRFRANIFRQRGSYGAVIRVIPFGLPDPDEMNIPEPVMRLADLNRGLVLVTGPTGCGKSTTLACMLDRMNHKRTGHILTMEDPIEFVHKHGSCIITQREIPTDIANYSEALRSAMRESPDVILLGEMRDAETIGTAINAAADGTVIFSGEKGTYGNLVILSHGNGFLTYYAHCSKLLVQVGDSVTQGQPIAAVGSTGRSTGPHCHFEVRYQNNPIDPLFYLPGENNAPVRTEPPEEEVPPAEEPPVSPETPEQPTEPVEPNVPAEPSQPEDPDSSTEDPAAPPEELEAGGGAAGQASPSPSP